MICCCATSAAQMYSLGGDTVGTEHTTCDKTDFGTETTSAVSSANLSQARYSAGAVGNPAIAGYIAGGWTNLSLNGVATADKLNMTNDTTAAQSSANLSLARGGLIGLSERSSKGYFAGGDIPSGGLGVYYQTADKITFSGDTTGAQTSANLSIGKANLASISQGSTKGYWGGGTTSGNALSAVSDKIVFSSDTTAAQTSANLSHVGDELQGGSDGSTHGYWIGGQQLNTGSGSFFPGYDKLTFSTDTTSTLSQTLKNQFGAFGSDGNKVFIAGGTSSTGTIHNAMEKITCSNDTWAALGAGANLSVSRRTAAGVTTVGL